MKYSTPGLVFAGALFAVTAAAQQPSDSVKWVGTDKLEIKSTVIASDGCYSAGPATAGNPAGSTAVQNAVLVTYSLKHTAGMCTQALTPVTFSITTDVAKGAQAIVLYTIDAKTKSTSARALTLPAK
jgi:hypothetical protein